MIGCNMSLTLVVWMCELSGLEEVVIGCSGM